MTAGDPMELNARRAHCITATAIRAVGYPLWLLCWAALCVLGGVPLLPFWWYPPLAAPSQQDGEPSQNPYRRYP